MTKAEAVNWIINLTADIGKIEHQSLWHYEQALSEIREMLEIKPEHKTGRWIRHPEQKNIYGGKCIECSECGEKYMVQYIEDEKYCRNCGCKMEVDPDE